MRRNIMGDILKEAIADAKAVRETALLNAKAALEEAFTPQLKSMLSAKLKEDEFEDEEAMMEPEMGAEEPEIPAEEGYYEDEELGAEEPEMPASEVPGEVQGAEEVPLMAQDEVPGMEVPGEVPGEEFPGEEDELDLEAIIRELEMEIGEGVEDTDRAHTDNVEGDEMPEHGAQTPMGEQANDNGNGNGKFGNGNGNGNGNGGNGGNGNNSGGNG